MSEGNDKSDARLKLEAEKWKFWGTIIVAMIGAAATILVAIIQFRPAQTLPTATSTVPTAMPQITPTSAPTTLAIEWQHNPDLPLPQDFPGRLQKLEDKRIKERQDAVQIAVSEGQMLMISGYSGSMPELGEIGGPTHCFLVITRGPFISTASLTTAGIVVYEADSEADTLVWAAQKVANMKDNSPDFCANGVDLWVGR